MLIWGVVETDGTMSSVSDPSLLLRVWSDAGEGGERVPLAFGVRDVGHLALIKGERRGDEVFGAVLLRVLPLTPPPRQAQAQPPGAGGVGPPGPRKAVP